MDVVIDPNSVVAPCEQVRAQLAALIVEGTLPVGTKLPTVRALAEELQIAANTAARVYRELEAAGLVETRGRAGTVVSARGDESRERARRAAADYAAAARALGLSRDEALAIVTAALD